VRFCQGRYVLPVSSPCLVNGRGNLAVPPQFALPLGGFLLGGHSVRDVSKLGYEVVNCFVNLVSGIKWSKG
jgi:hypothetical protein